METNYNDGADKEESFFPEPVLNLLNRKKRNQKGVWLVMILICLMLLGLIKLGLYRMNKAYEQMSESAYQGYYDEAFKWAEERNHVANYGVIHINSTKEISRLEVLKVRDTVFVIKNADSESEITSWLEVKGIGVFTVDLQVSEFISDNVRQHVLVKVPKPVLTECTIENTGKQFWMNDEWFKGDIAEGVNLSISQMSDGKIMLQDSMKQNRRFHDAAKEATVKMIEALVKEWNPDMPDLQVEVEFVEEVG